MASTFWQTVIRFDASKIAPEVALRNTVGIVTPLIVGAITGHHAAGAVAAIGALNVCFSDSREAYAVRGRRMLLASVLVAAAVTVGALSAWSNVTAVLAATVWAFGVGMLVVLGAKAGDLGAITLVTLIVFAARQLSLREALVSGVLAFAGGLLETALSVWIWPIKPYQPEKNILGELYRTLAEVSVSPAGAASAPPASAAVVNASELLSSLESNPSNEAERLIFLLDQAERIRLSVLTLRRLARRLARRGQGKPAAEAVERVLCAASAALRLIGDSVEKGQAAGSPAAPQNAEFSQAERDFRDGEWQMHSAMGDAIVRDAKHQVEALAGWVRAAAGLSSPESVQALFDASARASAAKSSSAKPRDLFARRERLRANLSFRSTAFRHAVRLAVCVGLGDALSRSLNLERTYWVPMTVAIVLKPDFVGTFSRGILRIAGTLVGLLVATVAFHFLPNGIAAEIALLAVFTVVLRWIGPANYGIFVAAVTGLIVLLIALTGVNPKEAIAARAVNTALGGALALLAYWIWPTWESTQIGNVLGDLPEAYRSYFGQVMEAQHNGAAREKLDAIRNSARLARSNVEASVSRFIAEPRVSAEERILLNEMLVSSHAFARATMAIESAADEAGTEGEKEALAEFAEEVGKTLALMADSFRSGVTPAGDVPDIRAAWNALGRAARSEGQAYSLLVTETDRIVTSLNTLWEQMAKWNKIQRS